MKNDLQGYLKNDLLGSIKQTNAPLYSSLLAVKKAFIKRFQLDVFPLVPHNAPKGSVNSDRNEDIIRYPFSYWKFQTLNLVKEEQNAKTIRRRGSVSTGSSSNTDFNIGYFFPALLNCQYNYETNQLEDALAFMERWLILLTSESLNVKITLPIGQGMEFTCRIFIEDTSIQLPEVEIDEESAPQVFRYELPFSVRTYIGTHKNVPKFNNEGEIEFEIEVDNG